MFFGVLWCSKPTVAWIQKRNVLKCMYYLRSSKKTNFLFFLSEVWSVLVQTPTKKKKLNFFQLFMKKKVFKKWFFKHDYSFNMHSKLSNLAPAFKRYRANTFATSYCFDRKVKVFLPPKTRFLGSCGVPSSV